MIATSLPSDASPSHPVAKADPSAASSLPQPTNHDGDDDRGAKTQVGFGSTPKFSENDATELLKELEELGRPKERIVYVEKIVEKPHRKAPSTDDVIKYLYASPTERPNVPAAVLVPSATKASSKVKRVLRRARFLRLASVALVGALMAYVASAFLAALVFGAYRWAYPNPEGAIPDYSFVEAWERMAPEHAFEEEESRKFEAEALEASQSAPIRYALMAAMAPLRTWKSIATWSWMGLWSRDEHHDAKHVIVYPLVDSINSEQCLSATPEDLRSGRILSGKVSLEELRTSMLYHLNAQGFSGICAEHVGVPLCYCVLDAKNYAPDGSRRPESYRRTNSQRRSNGADASTMFSQIADGQYIETFNARITGFTRNRVSLVQEKNAFCKKAYFAKRYEAVWVVFTDSNAIEHEKLFNGTHSFNLQHFDEIHHGLRSCLDDGTDRLAAMIRNRLASPDDGAAQAMLFTHPEAHRTHHPDLPSPKAPPKLPDSPHSDENRKDAKR